MVQDMTYHAVNNVYKEHDDDLKSLQAPELVLKEKFPRYTVAQVHELYTKATGTDTTNEKDLIPDEERWICEHAKKEQGCEAVFVTNFPKEAMKFYHKLSDDGQTVMWADLLFRGLEIATCPMRENRHEVLVEQMKAAGLDPNHAGYKFFLEAMKYGLPAHGGCGYGIDRLVEKTIGLGNVKEATLFPRDINRLSP
jgi:nondiscriminating aspartyl-tRNA synthetase